MALTEQIDHFLVLDRGKMPVELAYCIEFFRHSDAHHFVGQRPDALQGFGWGDRHRAHEALRLLRANRMQSRDHGRTSGEPIIDTNYDATFRVDRVASRRISVTPLTQSLELKGLLALEV